MKLNQLTFTEDAEGESYPATVTVTMTIQEAALLAKFTGGTPGNDLNGIMVGGADAGSGVYGCLVGDVFNRYWDDGVNEAIRSF